MGARDGGSGVRSVGGTKAAAAGLKTAGAAGASTTMAASAAAGAVSHGLLRLRLQWRGSRSEGTALVCLWEWEEAWRMSWRKKFGWIWLRRAAQANAKRQAAGAGRWMHWQSWWRKRRIVCAGARAWGSLMNSYLVLGMRKKGKASKSGAG
eukprot:1030368-Rhodomonas_salina.1